MGVSGSKAKTNTRQPQKQKQKKPGFFFEVGRIYEEYVNELIGFIEKVDCQCPRHRMATMSFLLALFLG